MKNMKTVYFAYGSNMNLEQMKDRCPGADNLGPAILKDWALKERTHADISPERGSEVHGLVWGVTYNCLKMLDRYEGFPGYYIKKIVWVKMYGCAATVEALVYVMTEQIAKRKNNYYFDEFYAKACAKGARDNGVKVDPLFKRTAEEWKKIYDEDEAEFKLWDYEDEFEDDDEECYYQRNII